jgi:hypothetical protein
MTQVRRVMRSTISLSEACTEVESTLASLQVLF